MQQIKDPRKYSESYPESNIIISQALMIKDNKISPSILEGTLRTILKDGNDSLINVGLNLAPSAKVSQIIWQALNNAVDSSDIQDVASIFAIPIILVVGNKNSDNKATKLAKNLDVELLNNFFIKNNLINPCYDSFISGKLISPHNLAQIKPSQIYYWVRNIKNAKLWIPDKLEGSEVSVSEEGVFLRFLIGVAVKKSIPSLNSAVNLANYRQSSMQFMQLIINELKLENVTIFPIPFAPVNLLSGFALGDNYRTEIAIQVALSNVIRKIREYGLTPMVKISGVENAIELQTSYKEDAIKQLSPEILIQLKEVSLWHLKPYDDFIEILNKITDLLQEMSVEYTYAE